MTLCVNGIFSFPLILPIFLLRVELLNEITHLRLDRENIGEIDNLELLGNKVTNVYLQQVRTKLKKGLIIIHMMINISSYIRSILIGYSEISILLMDE